MSYSCINEPNAGVIASYHGYVHCNEVNWGHLPSFSEFTPTVLANNHFKRGNLLLGTVIDYYISVDEANVESLSTLSEFHSCNVLSGLLPVDHLLMLHVPDSYKLVEASTDYHVLRLYG